MKQEMELIKACTRALANANFNIEKAAARMKPYIENFTIAYYETIDRAKVVKKVNVDTLHTILKIVADEFGITIEQLQSSTRKREVVVARRAYIYLAVIDYGFQPTTVTRRVNRTHSSSSEAIHKFVETDFNYDDNERKYYACKILINEALLYEQQPSMEVNSAAHVLPGTGHDIHLQQMPTN